MHQTEEAPALGTGDPEQAAYTEEYMNYMAQNATLLEVVHQPRRQYDQPPLHPGPGQATRRPGGSQPRPRSQHAGGRGRPLVEGAQGGGKT